MKNKRKSAEVPMRIVGPVSVQGSEAEGDFMIPLATFETPLWASVARGAKISRRCGGINVSILDERMTRSVLLAAPGAGEAVKHLQDIESRFEDLSSVTQSTSRYAKLLDIHSQVVGNLIFLRLEFNTGDASGHNMATKAADGIMQWILERYPDLRHSSISGNYCADKKVSAVNGILGRGKYAIADIRIPQDVCSRELRSTARRIADLNVQKNLIGSNLAGSIRSANAHFANMLLAFYLATGQDAANIVEGSQGITYAEDRAGELYFSVTLPNIIVGTVGSGKNLEFVKDNLEMLGCSEETSPGRNARTLASIVAATVLCGELSLLAAQTNPGELMKAHQNLERRD